MTTTHLSLPELTASQSQKHVTHNEALFYLDTLVQLAVADKDLTAPPGSPTTGDRYIVGASATGDWASKDNQIATYDGDGWVFRAPNTGWLCWVEDEGELYFYDGGWSTLSSMIGTLYLPLAGGTMTGDLALEEASPSIRFGDTDISGDTLIQTNGVNFQISVDYNNVDAGSTFQVLIDGSQKLEVNEYGLGVGGSSADATNAFAFYGTNLLLNSGGSIDMKYNKGASGNNASMTFQTGFSTKALLGLLGNDDFTIKVGSSFTTAMVIDETTAEVTMPQGFNTGNGPLSGHAIVICGEEDGNMSVGALMSMGDGSMTTAGAVMPQAGKIVAAGMSITAGASGNCIVSVAVNKVENTSYQVAVNYSGSGVETGYTDFSSSPLSFSAGDALNMICNTAGGPAQGVVTSLYIVFD